MDWRLYALVGLLLALGFGLPFIAQRYHEYRLTSAGLGDLTTMTEADMHRHLYRLFVGLGYKVYRASSDGDAFAMFLVDGLQQRRGVMLRHWRRVLDESMIADAINATLQLEIAGPVVISVEGYTFRAREAAAQSGAILWGLRELTVAIERVRDVAMAYPDRPSVRMVSAARQHELDPIPHAVEAKPPTPAALGLGRRRRAVATVDGDAPPRCPRCGRRMVLRPGANREYWGCSSFPRCLGSLSKE